MRSKSLRDARNACTIAKYAWNSFIPDNSPDHRIAQQLRKIPLELGLPYSELRQRMYELSQESNLGAQLALLAATEGHIRSMASDFIADRRYSRNKRLLKLLSSYDSKGLPDRFRSLIEQFASAIGISKSKNYEWTRLIEYRNWLAHGRESTPPRSKLPGLEELNAEIDQALKMFQIYLRD